MWVCGEKYGKKRNTCLKGKEGVGVVIKYTLLEIGGGGGDCVDV